MTAPDAPDAVSDLLSFLDAAPSPYHAVGEVRGRLEGSGFLPLDERDEWRLEPGDRRYLVRGGGTLVAVELGRLPPSRAGFVIIGAHTDSPNLRVKPLPDLGAHGHRQLAVEVYGGVLFSTWLDRDLSIAGRVCLADRELLVRIDRPICRIPNLAIHLSSQVNVNGLVLNPQQHLIPTLGLERPEPGALAKLIADVLREQHRTEVPPAEMLSFDLCLYDVQRAARGGVDGELICSARLDNLASCHAAVSALVSSGEPSDATRVIALYDHEEVGSQSAAGAKSRFLLSVLDRVAGAYADGGRDATARAFARSLLVSADMAHAVHPNYPDKHDPQHAPRLGNGPVIKSNVNQSYATDAPAAAIFEQACREYGFSAQRFVARNDMPCGSTIGPISAALTGIRTVDVGNPMLGMHSCRETAAAADVERMITVLRHLLRRHATAAPKP